MFDLDGENLWMGEPLGKKPRQRNIKRVYRQKPKTRIVYVERPRTRKRTVYKPKQKQYSVSDYASATYKGAKSAYKGTQATYRGAKKTYKIASKFVSKIGKPKTMQDRSWKEKLRGTIYKKE